MATYFNSLFASQSVSTEVSTTLPLVAVTGFLDGIHPCAIAILIFFVAFLLSLQERTGKVLWLGSVYITVIFLTYLGIGVGFFSGFSFLGGQHFMAKLGAVVLFTLGIYYLLQFTFPGLTSGLSLPGIPRDKIRGLLKKASLPTVVVGAFLVGLCSVPCSGGIYAAINALLASRTTFLVGFFYLVVYNLAFVTPLIIILLLAFNPVVLASFGEWQQRHQRTLKLFIGSGLIILGMAFYFFVS